MEVELDQLKIDDFPDLKGTTVYASDGVKVGRVWEIVVSDETSREPELVSIYTGLFGKKRMFVPIQGARLYDGGVDVAYSREEIENSPDVDPRLGQAEADDLFNYYDGLDPEDSVDTTLLKRVAAPPAGGAGDLPTVSPKDNVDTSRPEREGVIAGGPVGGEERVMSSRAVANEEAFLAQASVDGALVERTLEEGEIERISVDGEDSGEIEILPDGSVSIPLLEEQVVMTKRVLVRERIIVRKKTVTQTQFENEADSGTEADTPAKPSEPQDATPSSH